MHRFDFISSYYCSLKNGLLIMDIKHFIIELFFISNNLKNLWDVEIPLNNISLNYNKEKNLIAYLFNYYRFFNNLIIVFSFIYKDLWLINFNWPMDIYLTEYLNLTSNSSLKFFNEELTFNFTNLNFYIYDLVFPFFENNNLQKITLSEFILPELFISIYLLGLILFNSFYVKFFGDIHNFNSQIFVLNIFRIIISVLFISSLFYLEIIHKYNFFFENSEVFYWIFLNKYKNIFFWLNFIQFDLIKIKFFILISSTCLLFFNINENFISQINFFKPTKYTTGLFEYPILILFFILLSNILLTSNHLMLVYLSIVGLSLCLYALIAFDKNIFAVEAAAKYFSIGALASGLMLFGIYSFYHKSQSLFLTEINIANNYILNETTNSLITLDHSTYLGILTFLFGFFFKLSAFPCHIWAPDVYDGSSLLITAFLMTITKSVIFFYLIYFLVKILGTYNYIWSQILFFSGLGSIIVGTFGAFYQNRLKRFLAFTSMSQIGLSLISLSCINLNPFLSIAFSIFNFILYIFTTLIFFIIIFFSLYEKNISLNENWIISFSIENLKEYNSYLTYLLTILILSMSGIPPLTGFFTKYLIFSLLFNKFPIIIFLLLLLHLVNTYNYLRLIQIMWFSKQLNFTKYYNLKLPLFLLKENTNWNNFLSFSVLFILFILTKLDLCIFFFFNFI